MATYSDNFNRADENPLSQSGGWGAVTGHSQCKLVSNQATGPTWTGDWYYSIRTETYNADQYAQAVFKGTVCVVAVRMTAATGYGYRLRLNAPGTQYWVEKDTGSGWTQLATDYPGLSSENTIKLKVVGTTLQVYFNGSTFGSPITDSSISSGAPALGLQGASDYLDDWESGDVITLPTVTLSTTTNITKTTATGNGSITTNGLTITAGGVCVGASANPTTSDSVFSASALSGAFTASITGRTQATTYHIRGYATYSDGGGGTVYSNDYTFTTGGSTYYINADTGNDSNTAVQAQSPSTPWRTGPQVTLQAGDTAYYERGVTNHYYRLVYDYQGSSGNLITLAARVPEQNPEL